MNEPPDDRRSLNDAEPAEGSPAAMDEPAVSPVVRPAGEFGRPEYAPPRGAEAPSLPLAAPAATPPEHAAVAVATEPAARRRGLSTSLPAALGCLAVLCVFLVGLAGILWSGVASDLIAAANGNVVVRVVKVARIGPDGQYHDDGGNVFAADNQGMAGRVVYQRIPRGYRGEAILIWERLDAAGAATEIRKPDVIPVTEAMNGTTWWYTLRQPFPPGLYQFSFALAGPRGELARVGTVRFEVRAGGLPPAATITAAPTPAGYRPPTRPPAQTPPAQPRPTQTPAVATATPTPRP